MNKKILLLCSALFVVCAMDAFSFGIGVRGGGGWNSSWGAGLLISPGAKASEPNALHFGFNWNFADKGMDLGVTADYWLLNPTLTNVGSAGNLHFYVGAGVGATLAIWEDDFWFGLGIRIPIGLDLDFGKVDVFLEVVPQVSVIPGFGFGTGGALGIRVWF